MELGVSKHALPLFQAAILGTWLLASLTCSHAIVRLGILKIKMVGTLLVLIGGIGFTVVALLTPQNPYLLTSMMMFYTFGVNWTQGLYFPEGMEILPEIKGVTASVLTSTRLLLAGLIVSVTSQLYNATIYPIASVVFVVLIITLFNMLLYEKSRGLLPISGTIN
jgi:DHA1 family bicyclomycin/chloramphenicol resistance-like MFS transporter